MTLTIGGTPFTLAPNDYIIQVEIIVKLMHEAILNINTRPYYFKQIVSGPKPICRSAFVGVPLLSLLTGFSWTLGDPFLTKFYSSFDFDNDRIGFATAA